LQTILPQNATDNFFYYYRSIFRRSIDLYETISFKFTVYRYNVTKF